jgi:hypothetical protein
MVKKEFSLFVSSNDTLSSNTTTSADGSKTTIKLNEPLKLPENASNIMLEVQSATVWWTILNIEQGVNDVFNISTLNTSDVLTNYNLVIPPGLYDLTNLQSAIIRGLENAGAKDGGISFVPDSATNKVIIKLNYLNSFVDFTVPKSFREILGFNSQVITATTAPKSFTGDNIAGFNTVNFFYLLSSLVDQGIQVNDVANAGVISRVLIDVPPGSQIVSQPFNPPKSKVRDDIYNGIQELTVQLVNDRLQPVNTNGEYFSLRILITYDI